ncbi:MAG: glycosyl hydrolase family 43 [Chitinophagales bacterium]|nr:glycosyl hydrolase family 43 [Chitinophagales bacterium]
MKIEDFNNKTFHLVKDVPLISPPKLTPLIADPTVLLPHETPDQKWHLFAHSVFGVQQFVSENGIEWQKKNVVVRASMRPFIFKENDTFYLFYEKYNSVRTIFSFLPGVKWYSEIEVTSSCDLIQWTKPKSLIQPALGFHQDTTLGKAVSNPCLLKIGNKYRLYYSSSLVKIPDCGFNEPLHITYAESDNIDGNYISATSPLFSPSKESKWNNLGAGSMKVIPCEDGFVAFQNGIYEHNGTSGSAICILYSKDGVQWNYLQDEPVLKPNPAISWMASHIYACDVKLYDGKIYLYFNARNHAHWSKGSEHIGLATAAF